MVRLEEQARGLRCRIVAGRVAWGLEDIGMFVVIEKGRRDWRCDGGSWIGLCGGLTSLVMCRKIVRDSIHGISKLLLCGNGLA